MIISASYKTDIPAFYGQWFRRRLEAGFCRMVNPYGRQILTIDLTPASVDGFVFWTRDLGPFFDGLAATQARGFPFTLQVTITGYPRALEHSVPDWRRSVAHVRRAAALYGPRVAVWRYDPVLFSDLTPPAWHRQTIELLAEALEGATDEVVMSFAQFYRKTTSNLEAAARARPFAWRDPSTDEKRAFLADIEPVVAARGMRLSLCTQPELVGGNLQSARCIDAARLSDVAGRPIVARVKGNRPGCLCHQSRDIGDYDTCPHGCVYCYAVRSRALAKERLAAHDPEGAFLAAPDGAILTP